MQPEGPNKSEERLQRYAKERRGQGGDFSLHPATRRLLQGEVARQLGPWAKEAPARLSWLGLWRGRFAVGGALAAVLIAASWFFVNQSAERKGRMELASFRTPAAEKNVALESDRFAFDTQRDSSLAASGKGIATVALAELRSEAEKPAPTRSRALDGLIANEFQLGAKVDTNNLALASKAAEGTVHYFADTTTTLPTTNFAVAALSLSPITDIKSESLSAAPQQIKSSGNVETGSVTSGGVYGVAAGAGLAVNNSPLLADNSGRFYKQNTPLPQVTLQQGSDESKRLQETPQLLNNQAQVAYRIVTDPAAAPQSVAAPTGAAAVLADNAALGESLTRPQAAGPQSGIESRSSFGRSVDELSRADNNANQRFFRQAAVPAEAPLAAVRQQADLFAKKSEAPAASRVLSEFTVEQRGNSVRLMDFDGSVYNGQVDAPVVTEAEKLKEDQTRDKDTFANRALREEAGGRAGEPSQGAEYSFRVSGSNVTLRQTVVVNGRFRRHTNATNASLDQRGRAGGVNLQGSDAPAPAPAGLPATRRTLERFGSVTDSTDSAPAIEGTVRVGATNVQRFLAVPGAR